MQVNLYEWMINEDGTRSPGRQIGLIKFKGDGTPGKIEFFDTCNEIWDVRDVTHHRYTDKKIILNKMAKGYLASTLNSPINITTSSKQVGDVHYSSGYTLEPWHRETIEYILKYELPVGMCASICGKIVGPMRVYLIENIVNEDGTRSCGRDIGVIICKGDGSAGRLAFIDKACKEIWEVRDKNHPSYNSERIIFTETDKERLRKLVTEPIYITQEKKWGKIKHYRDGKTLNPWCYESLTYIMDNEIPDSFDTICAKFH
ncbi:MAG: hypothetical protein ABRQ39_25705 [Candidatus Eremiobacterota bacterium]